MSHKQSKKTRPPAELIELIAVSVPELNAIVELVQTRPLTAEEAQKLKATFSTLDHLKKIWQSQSGAIRRLLKTLFGPRTEKTEAVLGRTSAEQADAGKTRVEAESVPSYASSREDRADPGTSDASTISPIQRKGHGRNGVTALTGAKRVPVPHEMLARGEACLDPLCDGKVYPLEEPKKLVRIQGVAPLMATVYECDRLRCNLCLEVYTAPAPEGIGEQKYDETATATIGLLRYDCGLPHNQIERLQEGYGVPCPTSTQWDLVEEAGEDLEPGFHELIRQGAQKNLQHTDDTKMRVLGLTRQEREQVLGAKAAETRTGVFTSAIVSVGEGVKIALFFTGPRHAGENLNEVLKRRAAELPMPIQMCDASDTNRPRDFETLLANCMSHARRRHVDAAEDFPEEARFVLESLREVYQVDREAREAGLSPKERLVLHQERSRPWVTGLRNWMRRQLDERLIEPNSGLGEAITYMQDHWGPLTVFLRTAGAPLDNNLCERVLKKAIRHRKNSLYYRTAHGAEIGDIWMSLIHTAEMNGVSAFEYLVALLRHPEALKANPGEWMPWTYQATLERMRKVADPPTAAVAA